MRRKLLLLVFFIVLSILNVLSQNKLSLLDGKVISLESYIFHEDENSISYTFLNKKGKTKEFFMDYSDIYSITIDGQDSIFYSPFEDNDYSIEEMKSIITGRQTAQKSVNPWWAFASGAAVGCGSMYIYDLKSARIAIPVGYVIGSLFVRPTESSIKRKYPEYANDNMFINGYQSTASKKIFRNSLLGTISGIFIYGAVWGIENYNK